MPQSKHYQTAAMNSGVFLIIIIAISILKLTVCSNEDSLNAVTGPEENANDLGCHRVDYEVDFEDLGLQFIRKPRKVNIRDCQGHCSFKISNNTHYSLKSLLPDQPTPCCVHVEFEPLSVVITKYSSQTKKFSTSLVRLSDAIISKCGCL